MWRGFTRILPVNVSTKMVTPMTPEQHEQVVSIIDEVNDLSLATLREDGYPQANTVSYVSDGLKIYFGTMGSSQKAKNIAYCDKVSLTIDRPYGTWEEILSLSIGGTASVVTDEEEAEKAGELLMKKFPQAAGYESDFEGEMEDFVFIRIDPEVISLLDYSKGFGHTELLAVE